jgi:hypothetical protein
MPRSRLVSLLVLLAVPLVLVSEPAQAAPASNCSLTGYTAANAAEARQLRERLAKQSVNDLAGVRLVTGSTWKIPSGTVPVVVVDAGEPLRTGSATMSAFGLPFDVASGSGGNKQRYVSDATLPLLGSVTRTVKVEGSGGSCAGTVTIVVDRSPYSTVAGLVGIVLAVAGGALAVLFARRRGASRLFRLLLGGAFGVLAGLGEGLVLHEARILAPDSDVIWILPFAGLAIAVLLALLRRNPRPAATAAPFTPIAFGRYQAIGEFDQTGATVRYRGVDTEGEVPVLLTTGTDRLLLDRHVAVLQRLAGPQLPRVRDVLPAMDGAPVIATEPQPAATLRQTLDGPARLTGAQSAAVLRDVLIGLGAVHEAGLVHRDITPMAVHLADGAFLGTFELARPGDEGVDLPEGQALYLSPEQRRHEPLDARSDLYGCGLLLAELLTGSGPLPDVAPDLSAVPPPMAALIQRALAADPAQRPQSAAEFRTELEDAASAAYGPDWLSLGALTGAVVVPGGALLAAGGVLAGSAGVVTSATGTGALGVGATTVLGAGPLGSTTSVVAVTTAKSGATKVSGAVPALAGGAVAVVLGVVAAVAGPAPAAANDDVLDAATARMITVNTWTEARGGDRTHVGADLGLTLTTMLNLPGLSGADLTDIKIGIPRGQKGYPAYFIATATAKLPDGRTVYIVARLGRASADQPWTLVGLRYATDSTKVAVPAIDPDGFLAPTPPVGELAVDPAAIAKLYADWGNRTADSNSVGTDPALIQGPGDSFLNIVANRSHVEREFYHVFKFTVGSVDPPLALADGTVLVSFTGLASHELYNRPAPTPGDCNTPAGRRVVHFGNPGMPTDDFRQVHVDWVIPGEARIPLKSKASKATIQDGRYLATNPRSVAC